VHEAWKTVAGSAPDALALLRILLVEKNPDRKVKGSMAESLQIVAQLLDP
jgi:hypothetical protein